MIRTYQYRALPSKGQEKDLAHLLGMTRALYNAALQERIEAYQKKGISITKYDQIKSLTEIRKDDPDWAAINVRIQRVPLIKLDNAFQAFFKRVKAGEKPGFPRFKGYDRWRTIGLQDRFQFKPQNAKWHRLSFKGMRGSIRIWMHRPLPSNSVMKTAELTRDSKGWRLSLVLELPDAVAVRTKDSVGIDVGIKSFLVTDEGEEIANPRPLEKQLKKLRVEQRSLARKKRGSGNRDRQRKRVAKLHERITNVRRNLHWQAATWLCEKNKSVVIEDLNIKGLAKSKLARQVNDVAWGQFFQRLECKTESTGIPLTKVDPKYTSQQCSGCGAMVRKSLAVRVHSCDECGLELDRDHNAAVNIKKRGGRSGSSGR